jgi:hypothetical protein
MYYLWLVHSIASENIPLVTPYELDVGIFRCKNELTFVDIRPTQIQLFEELMAVCSNKKRQT